MKTKIQFSLLMMMLPILVKSAPVPAPSPHSLNATTSRGTATTTQNPLPVGVGRATDQVEYSSENCPDEEFQEAVDQFVIADEQSSSTTRQMNEDERVVETTTHPPTTQATQILPGLSREVETNVSNYIADETEYEHLLRRLASETENSITADRANYVADEVDLETVIRMIDSATAAPTDELGSQQHLKTSNNTGATTEGASSSSNDVESRELDRSADCPICLDSFGGEEVTTTECLHKFHKKCLTAWQGGRARACPLCRMPLAAPTSAPSVDCGRCLSIVPHGNSYVRLACGHIFHKECLLYLYRTRPAGSDLKYCPTCRQHRPELTQLVSYWNLMEPNRMRG